MRAAADDVVVRTDPFSQIECCLRDLPVSRDNHPSSSQSCKRGLPVAPGRPAHIRGTTSKIDAERYAKWFRRLGSIVSTGFLFNFLQDGANALRFATLHDELGGCGTSSDSRLRQMKKFGC